jgi:hypothetical protein
VRALHCANGHHFNLLICPNLSERRLQRFGECFDREDLLEIAKFTEEANRPRVISQTGNNLFRGLEGAIGDSNPIGSIEDGPVFVPAPGVNFSHHELLDIAQRLRNKAEAAKA